jgi:hypothetical protein
VSIELTLPHAHARFEEGELTDQDVRAGLDDAVAALAEEIRQGERAKVVA